MRRPGSELSKDYSWGLVLGTGEEPVLTRTIGLGSNLRLWLRLDDWD